MAFISDSMEEWHRYCLPAFIDRMKARYRGYCEDGHQTPPGKARNDRYDAADATLQRNQQYSGDSRQAHTIHGARSGPLSL